jgi:hypothetical protein
VCGASLAIYYLPQFTVASFMWVFMFIDSCATECVVPDYPIDSIKGLMELVLGMLGLAGKITKPGVKVYRAAAMGGNWGGNNTGRTLRAVI